MSSWNIIRLPALIVIFFSLSCQKRGQFEVPCKIKTITWKYRYHESSPEEIYTYTFHNNAWGDPDSIIQSNPGTGHPHYFFTYDNKHRLKTFTAKYEGEFIEYYTRYFYDNNGFIVRDTTLFSGTDINNPASFYQTFVSTYNYDSKARVSKVNFHVVGIPASASEKVYSYDANNNMVRSGTYDNKLNYLRTSLVLAFMMRDYSKNNYYPALSYNAKNLPTSWPVDGGGPSFFTTPITEIQYTCDDHDIH